jgi:hypothetical protein
MQAPCQECGRVVTYYHPCTAEVVASGWLLTDLIPRTWFTSTYISVY